MTAPTRNVVICADGTGNSFETHVSNVARLVRCLVLDASEQQLVFYDQGVGTKASSVKVARAFKNASHRPGLVLLDEPTVSWWPARWIARTAGLGFGYGLKANIREMYTALSQHYDALDTTRIFLFGFSRGAFTVRALAGFIHRCGLLPPGRLHRFSTAYARFYEERHLEMMPPRARETFMDDVKTFRDENGARHCRIHFLGLWDTVKSYGFIYPKSLPHLRHNPSVSAVRHALALNERRSYYQPTSWGGVDHALYRDTRPDDPYDVKEVWFAGSHSDVGGGYPLCRSGLARAPFEWMVSEAQSYELSISESAFRCVLDDFAKESRLNESLRRWWWIAEALPRFELENIPVPGQRVLKWGSTGRRDPLEVAREGHVYVHASVRETLDQLNWAPEGNTIVRIETMCNRPQNPTDTAKP